MLPNKGFWAFFALALALVTISLGSAEPSAANPAFSLRVLLETPAEGMDFARAKLLIVG
jgi:hypothetical protein